MSKRQIQKGSGDNVGGNKITNWNINGSIIVSIILALILCLVLYLSFRPSVDSNRTGEITQPPESYPIETSNTEEKPTIDSTFVEKENTTSGNNLDSKKGKTDKTLTESNIDNTKADTEISSIDVKGDTITSKNKCISQSKKYLIYISRFSIDKKFTLSYEVITKLNNKSSIENICSINGIDYFVTTPQLNNTNLIEEKFGINKYCDFKGFLVYGNRDKTEESFNCYFYFKNFFTSKGILKDDIYSTIPLSHPQNIEFNLQTQSDYIVDIIYALLIYAEGSYEESFNLLSKYIVERKPTPRDPKKFDYEFKSNDKLNSFLLLIQANSLIRLKKPQKANLYYSEARKVSKDEIVDRIIMTNQYKSEKLFEFENLKNTLINDKRYKSPEKYQHLRNKLIENSIAEVWKFTNTFRNKNSNLAKILKKEILYFILELEHLNEYTINRIFLNSSFEFMDLSNEEIRNKTITSIDLRFSDLRNLKFVNTNLSKAKLDSVLIHSMNWFDELKENNNHGVNDLVNRYKIVHQNNNGYIIVTK